MSIRVTLAILAGRCVKLAAKILRRGGTAKPGEIALKLCPNLPAILSKDMRTRSLNPFFRKVVAQDGTLKNDGSRRFTPEELLHMDYLVENVSGSIPTFDEILPASRSIVRKLGIYRDKIPVFKEADL